MMEENMMKEEDYYLLRQRGVNNVNLHLELPYWKYDRFSLKDMTNEQCSVELCFTENIYQLCSSLSLPQVYRCYNRLSIDSVEALCVCLKRVAYPCHYADLVPRFSRPVPQLCMICNLVDDIYSKFSHLLTDLNQPWLCRENLKSFATPVHNKGAALDNCWGFVDGTVRPICMPKHDQTAVYNGRKRVHALKLQSVAATNSMVASPLEPVEGRRHVSRMLPMSGQLVQLEQQSFSPDGQALCIYGERPCIPP